jgi:glycosyltransferase involved in cell wall biosynthesis
VLAATPASSAVACELRRAGEAGRRVDPADPVALAEAMITLQAAPRQRALMGRAALRYARTNLGRAAALRRLEFVVDAALPGRTQEEGR